MRNRTKPKRFQCEFFVWTVFRRGRVWYADGRSKPHRLGKHSLASHDRDEAIQNLRRLDYKIAVDRGLAKAKAETESSKATILLETGWDLYLAHCDRPEAVGGISPNSLRRYKVARNIHLKFCGSVGVTNWHQIDSAHAAAYARWLERRERAQDGIVFDVGRVRAANRFLIEIKQLPESAHFKLKLVRTDSSDRYCYTRGQVARMLQLCRSTSSLEWLYNVIVVLACTGVRISELIALRASDIDLESRTIRLTDERGSKLRRRLGMARRMKGKRSRVIPINPQLFELLVRLPRHDDGRLLHGPDGSPLVAGNVRYALRRCVIRPLETEFPTPKGDIGFVHGCLHSYRHYFVSQAFRQGATESQIMEWVGHRDSKIVARYRHLRPEDGVKQMSQLSFLDHVEAGS